MQSTPRTLFAVLLLLAPVNWAVSESAINESKLERFVVQDCGSCHGLTMKGGLGSPLLPERMRDLEDEYLETVILDGMPGTAMPPWRPLLTEDEARWIVRFLRERTGS